MTTADDQHRTRGHFGATHDYARGCAYGRLFAQQVIRPASHMISVRTFVRGALMPIRKPQPRTVIASELAKAVCNSAYCEGPEQRQ